MFGNNKHEYGPGPIAKLPPVLIFVVVGTVVLLFLIAVPIWNAISLLENDNYTYWCKRNVPNWTITLCLSVVLLYIVSTTLFFTTVRKQAQTMHSIMMLGNVFITALGVVLILVSIPLSQQASDTYNDLVNWCDTSESTHRLFEYSQVLQTIRQEDSCRDQVSVESCDGYLEAPPYTGYLKTMEDDFHCSGFCYKELAVETEPVVTNAGTTSAPTYTSTSSRFLSQPLMVPLSMLGQRKRRQHSEGGALSLSLDGVDQRTSRRSARSLDYFPPSLFSNHKGTSSCESMAARDMKRLAGDSSYQMFFQGVLMVLTGLCMGLIKVVGLCFHKERYAQP